MDGNVADGVSSDPRVDSRTVGTERPETRSGTSLLPPPYEVARVGRVERGRGDARAVRRRDRRRLAAPAVAVLFVAFLAASSGALGGERLQGVADWARIFPPGPGITDAGGEARAGQAATVHGVDGRPSGVKDAGTEAGVRRVAVGYYEAVDRENWAYTYGNLDSQSRRMFTGTEWRQRNQWFADNEGLELASMEVDVTRLSASGTHAEVNVHRTFKNGVGIDRDTVFVFEGGSWKHRLVGRELFLFMPGATYEEFVEAR